MLLETDFIPESQIHHRTPGRVIGIGGNTTPNPSVGLWSVIVYKVENVAESGTGTAIDRTLWSTLAYFDGSEYYDKSGSQLWRSHGSQAKIYTCSFWGNSLPPDWVSPTNEVFNWEPIEDDPANDPMPE